MNFQVHGTNAISGIWRNGLTGKPITWVLVYQVVGKNSGRAWTGDYVKSIALRPNYEIVLVNVAGPLKVNMSLGELTGMSHPQNPVFLSLKKPTTKQVEEKLAVDISELLGDEDQGKLTIEKKRLILARLGQGKFRQQVLKLWNGACAVSGTRTLEAIRASHIIPWSECTDNKMKLNPENGLPLVATLDALFDRGLISFESDGAMLISRKVRKAERKLLGIPANLTRKPPKNQQRFLEYHRGEVFDD